MTMLAGSFARNDNAARHLQRPMRISLAWNDKSNRGFVARSLPAEQADARGEGAAKAGAERGFRVTDGIDHIVDDEGIAASRDVVEAASDRQVVAEEMEALFELEIERGVVGKALGSGQADQLLLGIEQVEGKSSANFHGVGDFELVHHRQLE